MIGVMLDKHITMEQHVTSVCRAARYHLYNMGKIRKFLSQSSTEQLDYCNALLCGLPSSLSGRMQKIQNIAARIVTYPRCYKIKNLSQIISPLSYMYVNLTGSQSSSE